MAQGNDLESVLKLVLDQKTLDNIEQDTGKLAKSIQKSLSDAGKEVSASMSKAMATTLQELGRVEKEVEKVTKRLHDAVERRGGARKSGDTRGHIEASEEVRQIRSEAEKLVKSKQALVETMSGALEGKQGAKDVISNVEQAVGKLDREGEKQKAKGGILNTILFGRGAGRRGGNPLLSGMAGLGQSAAGIPFGAAGLGGVASSASWLRAGLGVGIPMMAGTALLAGAGASIFAGMGDDRAKRGAAGVLGIRGANTAAELGTRFAMSGEEALNFAVMSARATGTGAGARNLLALQTGYGLGGAGASVLGAAATQGQSMTAREQARITGEIIGSAAGSKLERGRFGEVMEGVANIVRSGTAGTFTSTGAIGALMAALGRGDRTFQGSAGYQFIGAFDALAKGRGRTPVGNALSLLSAGFGGGTGYIEALQRQELGLFGKFGDLGGGGRTAYDATAGAGRFRGMINQYRRFFGNDAKFFLAQSAGVSISSAERLMKLSDKGGLTDAAIRSAQDKDKPTAEKAAEAIVKSFGGADSVLEQIKRELVHIGHDLMPIMISALQTIATAVEVVAHPGKALDAFKDVMGPSYTGADIQGRKGEIFSNLKRIYSQRAQTKQGSFGWKLLNDEAAQWEKAAFDENMDYTLIEQAYGGGGGVTVHLTVAPGLTVKAETKKSTDRRGHAQRKGGPKS